MGNKKRLKKMIEESYGKNPLKGWSYYNAEKRLNNVRRFHEAVTDEMDTNWKVDEVTWNDLEMDQVFLRVNHTNSFLGEQMLYHRIHVLDKGIDEESTKHLEKRLQYFAGNPDKRLEIETKLQYIGKLEEGYYLPEFLINSKLWKLGNAYVYHGLQILLVLFLLLGIIFDNILFLAGGAIVALVNLGIYIAAKQRYEIFFTSLIEFKKVYDFAKWLCKTDKEHEIMPPEVFEAVTKLGRMSWVISGMNGRRQNAMTGDVMAILREYLWGILLIDVAMFNHIMEIISDRQREVLQLIESVGVLDSDISIMSYRESLKMWCIPKFDRNDKTKVKNEKDNPVGIHTKRIAHPLLDNPVTNDFELKDRAIITGSNASGKSTFMKSIAINCIMAQSIYTCNAESFSAKPLMVVTCMALRDDILTGESYYYREAKCLKRMLDLVVRESDVLVVVDEILKGTNTKERIAASKSILDYIGQQSCLVLVATHDNELTESTLYHNYHFCNEIKDDDIIFDYLIHEGKSTQSNAISLLEHLGYPEKIVENARKNLE